MGCFKKSPTSSPQGRHGNSAPRGLQWPQGLLAVIGLMLRHKNKLCFQQTTKTEMGSKQGIRKKQHMKTVTGISLEKREIPRPF